jgi:glyoxylase-like metal-dependent hydrolase (beta-lactamase superfamily II)
MPSDPTHIRGLIYGSVADSVTLQTASPGDSSLRADKVLPGVQRVTAPNPGPKTLQGTNVYLVGEERVILIDSGPSDASFIGRLASLLGDRVTGIVMTHDHPDHAGGLEGLAKIIDAPIWMSPKSDPVLRSAASARDLLPNQSFLVGSDRLIAIEMPGHSWDHVCFWLEGERVLFSGDNVLGFGTTLIALPEGDMCIYMETLERMRALGPRVIAPGHGPMILDPITTIDEYLDHRRAREQEVLRAIQVVGNCSEIVQRVYGDVPVATFELALLSVEAQLAKLVSEGRVERVSGSRYRVRPSS